MYLVGDLERSEIDLFLRISTHCTHDAGLIRKETRGCS